MVTECLLTCSKLIKMYLPLHGICRMCTLYLQSVSFMQMLTQFIWSFKLHKCFCLTQQFYQKAWMLVYHYNNHPVWRVLSVLAVILCLFDAQHTSIGHVFWCPRQTQHLRLETSFRQPSTAGVGVVARELLEITVSWKTVPSIWGRSPKALLWVQDSANPLLRNHKKIIFKVVILFCCL